MLKAWIGLSQLLKQAMALMESALAQSQRPSRLGARTLELLKHHQQPRQTMQHPPFAQVALTAMPWELTMRTAPTGTHAASTGITLQDREDDRLVPQRHACTLHRMAC